MKTKLTRTFALIIATTLILTLFAACGGGSEVSEVSSTTTSNATVSVSPSSMETPPEEASPASAEEVSAVTSAFDGIYKGDFASFPMTVEIANGQYKLSSSFVTDSGDIAEDGSFDVDVPVYDTFHFVHEQDSYWFIDSVSNKKNVLTREGGRSLYSYMIEEQTANMPDITHKHEYTIDSSLVFEKGNTKGYLEDGILYTSYAGNDPIAISDDPMLFDIKRLFYNGGDGENAVFFFIDDGNNLWAVGNNGNGKLGDGTGVNRSVPVKVLDNVVDVEFSGSIVYAYKSDDTLWHWGNIGNEPAYSPELFMSDIAEMYSRELFLKTNGDLIYQSRSYNAFTGEGFPPVILLHKVKYFYANEYEGSFGVYVVYSDDSLYFYPNLDITNINSFVNYKEDPPISAAECEKVFDNAKIYSSTRTYSNPVFVLTNDGTLYGKGDNSKGQLGDGTKINRDDWVKIADGVSAYGVNDDGYYYYEKTDGSIYTWTSDDPTPTVSESVTTEEQ